MARIIVITSGKGGVGKSTVCTFLGRSLAKKGKKVCLIDADLGLKNLDVMLHLESRVIYDFADVVKGRASLFQALVKDKECDQLFLLPACLRTDMTSIEKNEMGDIIAALDPHFDFIFIDSPAGIEKGFHQAIAYAKEAILVVTPDKVSIKDADKVIGLLESEGLSSIHVVINRMKRKEEGIPLEEIERVLGKKICQTIDENPHIRASLNHKEKVQEKDLRPFLSLANYLEGEKECVYPTSFFRRIMKKVGIS